ncbi:MAG: DUF3445 domain-containing protein [Burkholderiaceae bacterium]|nr:DUF3445 domain-containing protein [Burkholderiaceae bacterium]
MSENLGFDFDHAVTAPFRMQPGLRRLAPGSAQLTPAALPHRGVSRHLREKLAVLWAFADDALCSLPGFDARPALDAVAAQAAAEHPQAWQVEGARWRCAGLGWSLDADDRPVADADSGWPEIGPFLAQVPRPWRRAALLSLAFCEDLAIVDAASGRLPWLAVALPSMWAPAEKLGRSFAEVHAPVADNRLITGAAPQLLKLVTGAERWERFVWTLTPHPRLHAHPRRYPPERWGAGLLADAKTHADALAAQTWFRSERQSFIPLGNDQAIFTILVDTQPMSRALADPARAARVHAALSTMSEAVLAYRGLQAARPALLAWLERRAAS